MTYADKEFVFHRVYEMASVVEACANNPESLQDLDWSRPDFQRSLAVPSRYSILHTYIHAMIVGYHYSEFGNRDDIYEDSDEERGIVEMLFVAYGIPHVSYDDWVSRLRRITPERRLFLEWVDSQSSSFGQVWERMTYEVFHFLFGNRAFLLRFNNLIAEHISAHKINSALTTRSGAFRRVTFPTWVRKAVFYRDHGKCVLCQSDLTGLVSPDYRLHMDHMVPLVLHGTNDPCNLQLLCDTCNLRKSGRSGLTGTRYIPWWWRHAAAQRTHAADVANRVPNSGLAGSPVRLRATRPRFTRHAADAGR